MFECQATAGTLACGYYTHVLKTRVISALTLSPSTIGSQRTKSPLLTQTLLRNFVGILTRNCSPFSDSISCKLFPRPANIRPMKFGGSVLTLDEFISGAPHPK
uniref:Uncharacterized protein n=1 Tax=Romanomermis culicivorax TaxID=13658 RepID=A0A915HMF2_ROMCU